VFAELQNSLRRELHDKEYAHEYAQSFLNSYVATQIKAIREQRGMTQSQLGEAIGTTQAGISRIENVDYSSWNIRTLLKLARAFDVRLRVSFEPFGTLPFDVIGFNRANLQRVKREDDPGLTEVRENREVANIAIWRALNPQTVKSAEVPTGTTFENGDLGGFSDYATSSDKESTGAGDDRSGRIQPRRQGAFGGLRGSVGGPVQLSQFSQGA
jgi:transcriptional regulator with XRE-family HTH domain